MGFTLTKKTVGLLMQIWQAVFDTAQGGFTLDVTGLTDGSEILPGSPFGFDETTRKARLIKTATLHADATSTATDYQVKKGHFFKVGEFFAAVIGGKSYAITAIDTSDAVYDVITVGTTLGVALTAGAALFQSASSGASAGAFIVTPKGLLHSAVTSEATASVSIVLRGAVYARRTVALPTELRAALPLITFSESY